MKPAVEKAGRLLFISNCLFKAIIMMPLSLKLGIKPGYWVFLDGEPANYQELLKPIPRGVSFVHDLANKVQMVHVFATETQDLAVKLTRYRKIIVDDGIIWVSFPKHGIGIKTDVSDRAVRKLALKLAMVDTQIIDVDKFWLAMKLVTGFEEQLDD